MITANDFKMKCLDTKKAIDNNAAYWCKEYDEGFDFIDEYCEDCIEYQKFIYKLLPEVRAILES